MEKYTVAVIQIDTQRNKGENLKAITSLVDEAAAKGAKLVAMSEYVNCIGVNEGEGGDAEPIPGYTTEILMKKAAEHNMWIHCGSMQELNPNGGNPFNTTVFINNKGKIVCKYRKLHMFDAVLSNGTVCKESATKSAGQEIVTAETELGTFGFSICYDMRFPELYRIMALRGAQVIFVPANFTMSTGKDHWEAVLRTRAIENACYIVAPAQIGKKTSFEAFGKSLIIDPWGDVIARASDKACVITAEIDFDYLAKVRQQVPALKNRRADVYDVKTCH